MKQIHGIMALLSVVFLGATAFAETTGTATGTVAVFGYSISFPMLLSWLLVPAAFIFTEVVPVSDKLRPAVPFVLGAVAGILGHFVFGVNPEAAQAQFFGALAAGNMSGWIKVLIPWLKTMMPKAA